MKTLTRKPEFWLSAGGLAALCAVFALWWAGTAYGAAERAAAALSAALYAGVALRFVPAWTQFWREETLSAPPEDRDEPRRMEIKIFLCFLAYAAAVVLAVYFIRRMAGNNEGFVEGLSFWTGTDSRHYLDIARDWYLSEGELDRLVQLVFLPGYPLAIRLVHLLIPDWLGAAMLCSALCFAGAGSVLYRLLRLDMPHRDALHVLKYLCLLPGSFFFAAAMSESLFLLLCACCLYLCRTKRRAVGCLAGGLAAFTRSLGLMLVVPLVFELVRERPFSAAKDKKSTAAGKCAALLLIPAGFAAYCYINYRVSGNPFQYLIYQKEHWSQQLGWFFNTAAYQTCQAIQSAGNNPTNFLGLWLPNLFCSFAALAVMLPAARRLRASYTAWFLAYYLIAIGATWLLSAPRYLAALPPVPMALAMAAKKPAADTALTVICASLYLLYLCAFSLHWQVW